MIPFAQITEGLARVSRVFSVVMWHDYVDESYNNITLCVGGWIARLDEWKPLEASWKRRLQYEQRLSFERGDAPISRYHATDCANLKNEFDAKHGWDIPRQISLSKRLCEIIGANPVWGVVFGGSLRGIAKHFPNQSREEVKEGLYRLAFSMHLVQVGQVMHDFFRKDRVTVYYERSRQLGPIANAAFNDFMEDKTCKSLSKYFVSATPVGWEDCIPLQPADFLAYEGMKRVNGSLNGNDAIRNSLQGLIGRDVPFQIAHFTDDNFQDMMRMIENQQQGRKVRSGVRSKPRIVS